MNKSIIYNKFNKFSFVSMNIKMKDEPTEIQLQDREHMEL